MNRLRTVLAAGAAVVVVVAVVVALTADGTPTRPVSALFSQTPALYPGNQVQVLGMPVGTVTAVDPRPDGVLVKMQVDDNVTLPADAQAYLQAPQVVNDRSVQLSAYRGGPVMAVGAVIPPSRTHVPLAVDQVLANLDSLFNALGPTASSSDGVLTTLVATLNRDLAGLGPAIHATITSAGAAAGGLAADSPGLAGTLAQLRPFVTAAAADSREYQAFSANLAAAAVELNSQRSALAGTLGDLQQTLGQLTTFVQANQANLGSSLDNLDTATSAVAAKEQDLASILRVAPLALQNLDNAIVKTPTAVDPQVPFLQTRVDFVHGTRTYNNDLCGATALARAYHFGDLMAGNVVAQLLGPGNNPSTSMNLPCFFDQAAQNVGEPPGSPSIDLSLAGMLTAGGK
ncbi:MAG: MCE family protein [Actinomycetota bacterium]|jgi:phospholipid/cholesterol/gamma-HCH transport system substrate-binding protein|nr:MCE family protein [Actinomycetota bacterium]